MIELQHLSKWITIGGAKTYLLKDINLTIKQGEFVSIMGPQAQESQPCLML